MGQKCYLKTAEHHTELTEATDAQTHGPREARIIDTYEQKYTYKCHRPATKNQR